MPVDDEDMPPPQGQHPEPDLDDDPIEGGDPPSQPPGGGTHRAANTMTLIWICLWIRTRLAAIHLQEAVHRDRDLDMDHRRLNRRFFMESHDEAPPPRSAWCSWGGSSVC